LNSVQDGPDLLEGRPIGAVIAGNLVAEQGSNNPRIGRVERVLGTQAEVRYFSGTGDGTVETCALHTLRRFRYAINTMLFSRTENAYGIVLNMRETDGLATYHVQIGTHRKRIPEADVLPVPPASDPFELLRDGELQDTVAFSLAIQARRLQYAYSYEELVSLSNARIELLPHQVFVAHRILTAYPRSFLLADEVGLGKTIEAGLVIKELRARGAAKRVLIVAPAGLVPQWVDELQKKFNERFMRLDSATFSAHVAMYGAEAVWEAHDNVVTSLHLLRSNDAHVEALARQHWDVIVFDEAHHLRRYLNDGSREEGRSTTGAYRLAERLIASATTTLLLTATPLQLHAYELYSLIELLDPTLFPSFAEFERYRRQIPTLNALVQRLHRYETLSSAERATLAEQIATVLLEARNNAADTPAAIHVELGSGEAARARYMEALGDAHRLTAVMLRNRKRLVFDELQPRQARVLAVGFSQAERAAYDAVTAYIEEAFNSARATGNEALGFVMTTYRKILTSSSYALRQSFERRITRLLALRNAHTLLARRSAGEALDEIEEEELDAALDRLTVAAVYDVSPAGLATKVEHLRGLCHLLNEITIDAKADRLLTELRRLLALPTEKVLIFTQFKQTLLFLQELLQPHYRVATFYGGLDSGEKDTIVDRFRDPAGAQILIATEAAGEGRNLQFCHIMFNYDLPWNPMKIEQRLDRIGQERDVHIVNFALLGTVEERVLEVLNRRINAFEETIGGLDPILGQLELDVQRLMLESQPEQFNARLSAYADHLEAEVTRARAADAALRDLIIDRRSFDSRSKALFEDSEQERLSLHANKLSKSLLKYLGAEIRPLANDTYRIRLGREMRVELPGLVRDSYQVTFNYRQAVEETLIEYGSFGHPLFDALLNHVTSDAFHEGRTAQRTLVSAPHAGFTGLQFNFLAKLGAVPRLIVIVVGLDGGVRPDLRALLLDSFDWQNEQHALSLAAGVDWPALVRDLHERAEDAIERELRQDAARAEARAQEQHEIERRKLEQYFSYRETEGQRKLAHDEAVVARLSGSDRDEDNRVVPLWQRTVSNDKTYLHTLVEERERQYRELDKRLESSYSYELLSAACVTIVAPSTMSPADNVAATNGEAAK